MILLSTLLQTNLNRDVRTVRLEHSYQKLADETKRINFESEVLQDSMNKTISSKELRALRESVAKDVNFARVKIDQYKRNQRKIRDKIAQNFAEAKGHRKVPQSNLSSVPENSFLDATCTLGGLSDSTLGDLANISLDTTLANQRTNDTTLASDSSFLSPANSTFASVANSTLGSVQLNSDRVRRYPDCIDPRSTLDHLESKLSELVGLQEELEGLRERAKDISDIPPDRDELCALVERTRLDLTKADRRLQDALSTVK